MPYVATDPRAQLSTASGQAQGVPRPASYRELRTTAPDETAANGSVTWWTRSQALLIGHKVADVVVILGSTDIVMGEVDR